jgi:hypothetical protein
MAERPPSNVKIYDRPARSGPSAVVWVVMAVIIVLVGIFLYGWFHRTQPVAGSTRPGMILMQHVSGLESSSHGPIS